MEKLVKMKLADTLKLQNLEAYAAGSQATNPDSRKADDWIKKYLDDKQKRLNDLRVALHNKLDFNLRSYVATGASEKERQAQEQGISGSWQVYKDTLNQHPERMAGNGGKWAVVDREGLILSTWDTKEEAEEASFPVYHGIAPSATGPTSGTVVKKLEAEDMFQNPDLGDKTRAKFLKHPKPKVVKVADWLRDGDHRPSSHGGGAAGTGGAGGPSGGGGGTS